MTLLDKTDSLRPIDVQNTTWFELKALDHTWLDWRWVEDRLTVWVHELGWFECELYPCEDSEEELRSELEEHWIVAHYAEIGYFTVNVCCRGKLDG